MLHDNLANIFVYQLNACKLSHINFALLLIPNMYNLVQAGSL